MPRTVYKLVRSGHIKTDRFFIVGNNCTEHLFPTTDLKLVAAFRQHCLGVSVDGLVEMLQLSESLILKYRKRVAVDVVERFEKEYLRRPTIHDETFILARLVKIRYL